MIPIKSLVPTPTPPRVMGTGAMGTFRENRWNPHFRRIVARWKPFHVMETFAIVRGNATSGREVAQWELSGLQRDSRCKAPQISKCVMGTFTDLRRFRQIAALLHIGNFLVSWKLSRFPGEVSDVRAKQWFP